MIVIIFSISEMILFEFDFKMCVVFPQSDETTHSIAKNRREDSNSAEWPCCEISALKAAGL